MYRFVVSTLCLCLGVVAGQYGYGGKPSGGVPVGMDAPKQACVAPPNTVGLFVQTGTKNTYLGKSRDAVAVCTCEDGDTFFYDSATILEADAAKKAGQTAWSISTLTCDTFCVCCEGTCYEPSERYAYVDFLPVCDALGCHVYAVPFTGNSTSAAIHYGPIKDTNGNIFHAPGEKISGIADDVGSSTTHIKATAISCSPCSEALKNKYKDLGKCSGAKNACRTPAGQASLYIAPNTFSSNEANDIPKVLAPSSSCACDSGSRQFWAPSTTPIPQQAYSTKQLFILDSTANCPDMCLCDSIDSQNCYVGQTNKTHVELVPWCETDGKCWMYAAVYDDWTDPKTGMRYDGLKSKLTGEYYIAPDTSKDPISADSKYLKVSSISCSGCDSTRSAQCTA